VNETKSIDRLVKEIKKKRNTLKKKRKKKDLFIIKDIIWEINI